MSFSDSVGLVGQVSAHMDDSIKSKFIERDVGGFVALRNDLARRWCALLVRDDEFVDSERVMEYANDFCLRLGIDFFFFFCGMI